MQRSKTRSSFTYASAWLWASSNMLSNIHINQSEKSAKTEDTTDCKWNDAGPTPSGINFGSTCPHGVWIESREEVIGPSLS